MATGMPGGTIVERATCQDEAVSIWTPLRRGGDVMSFTSRTGSWFRAAMRCCPRNRARCRTRVRSRCVQDHALRGQRLEVSGDGGPATEAMIDLRNESYADMCFDSHDNLLHPHGRQIPGGGHLGHQSPRSPAGASWQPARARAGWPPRQRWRSPLRSGSTARGTSTSALAQASGVRRYGGFDLKRRFVHFPHSRCGQARPILPGAMVPSSSRARSYTHAAGYFCTSSRPTPPQGGALPEAARVPSIGRDPAAL